MPETEGTVPGAGEVFLTLLKLFKNKHSKDLRERQVATVIRLCKIYEEGFFICDLQSLSELISILGEQIDAGEEIFVEPLCEVLRICTKPFIKEIASEEYRNFQSLCDTLRVLGKLLGSPVRNVKLAAGQVLETYAGADGGQPATISYHHQVLANSQIAESVSAGLATTQSEDRQVLLQMLRVFLELSRTKELAIQLHEVGALQYVVEAMLCGFKTEVVSVAIEALWNECELAPGAVTSLAKFRTVEVYRDVLVELLSEGHRLQDKELRNELLLLCSYLADVPESQDFFATTGLLDLLLTHASAIEYDIPDQPVKPFVLTSGSEDFEMKRAMIHVVCLLASSPACMEGAAAHEAFIPALILHLDEQLASHPARRKYSRQHERQLQVQALSALAALVPCCSDRFLQLGGIDIVLEFMTVQSEEALRTSCLHLLLTSAGLHGFQEQMGGRAVAMMLSLVKERELHPYSIRQDAMSLLSKLCHNCPDNAAVVGDLDGVPVLIQGLEWTVEETTRDEPLSLTAVDAVWSAVAGYAQNELALEAAGGVGALLHLLEEGPRKMRLVVVSCLTELLENETLLQAAARWRSHAPHSRRGMVGLLLDLWEEEVAREEQERREHMELTGEEKRSEGDMGSGELVSALTEHSNMKTKLHALLGLLGFDHAAQEKLTPLQRKRLLEVRECMHLRDATLWRIMYKELGEEGIRPVTPDQRQLDARFRADERKVEMLEQELNSVEEDERMREDEELRHFYLRVHSEQAAKRSTARRITQAAPASTRTKIIVDSHKAQVYPPLINPASSHNSPAPSKAVSRSATARPPSGASAGRPNSGRAAAVAAGDASSEEARGPSNNASLSAEADGVEAFLNDPATARMANSRPSSGRPQSGRRASSGIAAGSGVHAAVALRAS